MANPNGNGPNAPMSDVVVFDNVLVTRQSEYGWHCDGLDGRVVFLSQFQIAPGTTMPAEGQRGCVTLTVQAAQDLNLRYRPPVARAMVRKEL